MHAPAKAPRPARRRVLAFAIVLLLVGGGVAIAVVRSWSDAPAAAAVGYRPQADRRYLLIGANEGVPLTDDQLRMIAEDYDVVVFAKYHKLSDISLRHEECRKLKALNPKIQVFAYLSTKYWFNGNDFGSPFDPAWFLRDKSGDTVPVYVALHDPTSKRIGSYIDVSNSDYRDWVLGIAKQWMAAAPYDGIHFDAADPIGDYPPSEVTHWANVLPPGKVQVYNEGIVDLFNEAKQALAPRQITFNGISPGEARGPGRDLSLLDISDGALDESFCLNGKGDTQTLQDDIGIMEEYRSEQLLLRAPVVPAAVDDRDLPRLQRLCVGVFLMGWQPGSTYLNMSFGQGVTQLTDQPADIDLEIGDPTAADGTEGSLLHRTFDHGEVFVNLSSTPVDVAPPPGTERMANGVNEGPAGRSYTLAPMDAAFFLDTAVTSRVG